MSETMPGTGATLGLSADEVLTTTRAVRRRLDLDRPVPRDVLLDCVRIAAQAPSGRNRQQWDFVFVDDADTKRRVADLWRRGLAAGVPGQPADVPSRMSFASAQWARIAGSVDHLAGRLHEMPVLMIPTLRVSDRAELTSVRGQAGGWGSVVPAFWSFMLAARERGLGTAWTTAHLTYEREMAEVLSIPFDTAVQVALTPVAFTLGTEFRTAGRATPESFSHWNSW